jgi:hypothetical protein
VRQPHPPGQRRTGDAPYTMFPLNFDPFNLGFGLSGYLVDVPAPAVSFRNL